MKSFRFLVILCVTFSLIACDNSNNEHADLDFGTVSYKEPFRGLLKSKPEFLVTSLEYPPCSWFKPDTAFISKTIEITFNEDAIRSDASSTIFLLNSDTQKSLLIQWYFNGEPSEDGTFVVKASKKPQHITIGAKIHPVIGEQRCQGQIYVNSNELDEISIGYKTISKTLDKFNSTMLPSDGNGNYFASWTLYHKYKWPLLLWLTWLIIAAIIILIIYELIKLILRSILSMAELVGTSKISTKIRQHRNNKNDIKKSSNNEQESNHCSAYLIENIKRLDKKIYSTPDISKKYTYLNQIREFLEINKNNSEELFNSLSTRTKNALDEFNGKIWTKTPKDSERGHWESVHYGHKYVLSKDNPYYESCQKLGITSCLYDTSGSPDFSAATQQNTTVNISDLYNKYNIQELQKRGGSKTSFQEVAQRRMAEKNIDIINRWFNANYPGQQFNLYDAFYKWRDSLNLVPHENGDCTTMCLVNRDVHKAFTHMGGVARACLVKDHLM